MWIGDHLKKNRKHIFKEREVLFVALKIENVLTTTKFLVSVKP